MNLNFMPKVLPEDKAPLEANELFKRVSFWMTIFAILGHRDAFLYVVSLVRDKVPVSERIICEIHSLVLMDRPEDKGVYRRIPVKIMGAHHEPPQPYLVPVQMERLFSDLSKDKRHTIETAALFHLNFGGIHPFIDGNGRMGG